MWAVSTVTESARTMSSVGSVVLPPGASADTRPLLTISPRSRSAWVVARVAVQVLVSPGMSATGPVFVPQLSVETPARPSLTITLASVTLPVFWAVKV